MTRMNHHTSKLLLLTIPLSGRPTRITLRLSDEEAKQLALLTALRTLEAKKRVTTRACIADMLYRAAAGQVEPPRQKTTPTLSNDAVAHRISLPTNEHIYAALDALRGQRMIKVDRTGMDLQENLEYGDADLIREILKIEYELQASRTELEAFLHSNAQEDTDVLLPRQRSS